MTFKPSDAGPRYTYYYKDRMEGPGAS